MRRQVAGWILASLAVGVSGCQSWSQVGQGIPSGSRVPPPGTGTYSVPQSYYNNGAGSKTGAVSSNAQPSGAANTAAASTNSTATRTAAQSLPSTAPSANPGSGASATATTANWQIPTVDQMRSGVNNTASAVFNDAGNRANQVVQAGTARAAAAVEKYTDPAPSLRPAGPPSANSLSTAPTQANLTQPNSAPSPSATSRSLSDASSTDEPQLDWQAPQ